MYSIFAKKIGKSVISLRRCSVVGSDWTIDPTDGAFKSVVASGSIMATIASIISSAEGIFEGTFDHVSISSSIRNKKLIISIVCQGSKNIAIRDLEAYAPTSEHAADIVSLWATINTAIEAFNVTEGLV